MFLRVLEYSFKTGAVVIDGGAIIKGEKNSSVDAILKSYSKSLAKLAEINEKDENDANGDDIAVIKPILLHNDDETVALEIFDLDKYGIPALLADDLGEDDIKPLKKEDYIVKKEINIEEVTNGLEQDVKEAIEELAEVTGGAKELEKEMKEVVEKGESIIEWIKIKLRACKYLCDDTVNNKYIALMDKINDKVSKLNDAKKEEDTTTLKKIGNFIFVASLQTVKALVGVVKFAADIVIAVAKYVGTTVVAITKGIGNTAKDIVEAFKTDLLNIYKPATV